jgi:hypothetical protein
LRARHETQALAARRLAIFCVALDSSPERFLDLSPLLEWMESGGGEPSDTDADPECSEAGMISHVGKR